MHEDEKKVRDAWDDPDCSTLLDGDEPPVVIGYRIYSEGGVGCSIGKKAATPSAAWSAAAAFTAERKQQIAEIDEEIAEVEFISRYFLDERLAVWQRILASRQAARAELRRGMRGEA